MNNIPIIHDIPTKSDLLKDAILLMKNSNELRKTKGQLTRILGNHAVAEIYGCEFDKLNNKNYIKKIMIEAINKSGAHIEKIVFKKFQPQGISGVMILSESHFSIHTWPEDGYAAVDAFTCGGTVSPYNICDNFSRMLGSVEYYIWEFERGILTPKIDSVFQKEDLADAF